MTIETGTNRKIRWLPLEANPEVLLMHYLAAVFLNNKVILMIF
jgi:hypothetical protein